MDAPTVNSKRNGSDPQAILNLPREDVHAKFNKSYLPTLEQLDSHAQDHPSLYTGSSSSEKKDGDKHDKDNNNNNSSTSNDELSDASAGPGTISEIIDLVASATDTSYPPNYNCSRENSSNVARKRTTTGDSDQTLTRVVAYEDILDDYCAIFPSASSSPKSSDQPAVMTNKVP